MRGDRVAVERAVGWSDMGWGEQIACQSCGVGACESGDLRTGLQMRRAQRTRATFPPGGCRSRARLQTDHVKFARLPPGRVIVQDATVKPAFRAVCTVARADRFAKPLIRRWPRSGMRIAGADAESLIRRLRMTTLCLAELDSATLDTLDQLSGSRDACASPTRPSLAAARDATPGMQQPAASAVRLTTAEACAMPRDWRACIVCGPAA